MRNIKNGDSISLEYSLNTLEFSMNKEPTVFDLEKKFRMYYEQCSDFLHKHHYAILGCGINPNYKYIDRHCLNQDRYLAIERLLKNEHFELLGSFCAYCCSIQTHINVSSERLLDVMNMFTRIERQKEQMFANSYLEEVGKLDSRKVLWEKSNFGPNNIGENPLFGSIEEIVDDYLERNLFFVERDGEYLIFNEKQKLKDYFSKESIIAQNSKGENVVVYPKEEDFSNFRSYRGVEITKYGTLEIRTDCSQTIDRIFPVVAFNVGVATSAKRINEYITKNGYIDKNTLIYFAIMGLKQRNNGEERYWSVWDEQNWNMDV